MYKIDKISKEKNRAIFRKKAINIILYIIIIPIIFYNITLIIKSFVNPNVTADFFGYKNFVIVSGSMEPTIMTGDAVFVKEVPQDEIQVNDIITFDDEESITTHRIVAITEEDGVKKYITKGDHNNVEDKEKVTFEKIEGKYQFKIKGFGVFVKVLQSKVTVAILILFMVMNYWYTLRIEEKKLLRKEKRRIYNKNRG